MGLALKALAMVAALAAIGFVGVAAFGDLPAPTREITLPIALQ